MRRVFEENINTLGYWNKVHENWEGGPNFAWWVTNAVRDEMVPLNATLIDVGCGSKGWVLADLRKERPDLKLSGCDFSGTAVRITREMGFEVFELDLQHPIEGWGKDPYLYDVVVCMETLEHLDEPMVALANLVKASNQWVIVSTPNEDRLDDPEHVWRFTKDDLRRMLAIYGDSTVQITGTGRHLFGVLRRQGG